MNVSSVGISVSVPRFAVVAPWNIRLGRSDESAASLERKINGVVSLPSPESHMVTAWSAKRPVRAAAAFTASVRSTSCHVPVEPAGMTTVPAIVASFVATTAAGTVRNSSGSEFHVSVFSCQRGNGFLKTQWRVMSVTLSPLISAKRMSAWTESPGFSRGFIQLGVEQ